jgi:hypothetical protein
MQVPDRPTSRTGIARARPTGDLNVQKARVLLLAGILAGYIGSEP